MTEITKEDIQALLIIAGKDDDRELVQAIGFEAVEGGMVMVATDGKRLLAIHKALDYGRALPSGRLTRQTAESMVKTARKGDSMWFAEDGTLTLGAVSTKLETGYVYWRRTIPGTISGETAQFDPKYIGEFGRISKLLGNERGYINIRYNGSFASIVELGNQYKNKSAFGLVMPIRHDPWIDNTFELPEWTREKTSAAA